MPGDLGITEQGLKSALLIKESYKKRDPVHVPDDPSRILLPEYLLNHDLDLGSFEDPLPLAMMATRDPESPMALAAVARLSPLGSKTKLVQGVYTVVGETSKHPLVRECVELVSENAFNPKAIAMLRNQASRFIVRSRREFSIALRRNLQGLLDGEVTPMVFVKQFFELTEAGNLQSDVRQKLVTSLLLSDNVRPGIKFLMLEHFERFPVLTRKGIMSSVLQASPNKHTEILKEEFRWIVSHDPAFKNVDKGVH